MFPFFTLFGLGVIMVAVIIAVAKLSPTASSNWGSNAKSTHDAAEVGSSLMVNLTTLQSIPKWLVPLAFLVVASFMTGLPQIVENLPPSVEPIPTVGD